MAQKPDDDDEDKDDGSEETEWKVNENFEWSLYSSSYFQITNKNRAKKLSDGSWRSCYGNNIYTIRDVNKDEEDQDRIKKVQWNLQVTNTASKNIMVGVCKTTWNTDANHYGSYNTQNGYIFYSASPGYRYSAAQSSQYGKPINGNNSIIIITLNLHDKTLSFNIDGQDYGVAQQNLPNAQYRLCMDISSPNDEITVVSEKVEYYNAFSIISSSFKEWFSTIGSINENIKKQELTLNNGNKKDNNKNNNGKSQVNLNKLLKNAHYISVIKQNKKKFEKELKEFDNNIVLYEKSLQQYLIPPKRDNYKSWKSDDIIKWIITLDSGAYIHYTKKLSKALQENQITGDDLKDISRNDLSLFGVAVFKDRVNLMKHFESLVSGNVNDNNVDTNIDEGEN